MNTCLRLQRVPKYVQGIYPHPATNPATANYWDEVDQQVFTVTKLLANKSKADL